MIFISLSSTSYYPGFGFRSGLKREEETKSANESSKPYVSNYPLTPSTPRDPETEGLGIVEQAATKK